MQTKSWRWAIRKNLHVFNFAILLKSRKSRKFYAREIDVFFGIGISLRIVQRCEMWHFSKLGSYL